MVCSRPEAEPACSGSTPPSTITEIGMKAVPIERPITNMAGIAHGYPSVPDSCESQVIAAVTPTEPAMTSGAGPKRRTRRGVTRDMVKTDSGIGRNARPAIRGLKPRSSSRNCTSRKNVASMPP